MSRVVSHYPDQWPALCPTMRINEPRCVPQRRKMTRVVSHNVDKCPTSWKKNGENLVKHGQLFPVVGHHADQWSTWCPITRIAVLLCVPQCGSLTRVVSHNADHWSALWDTVRKTRFSWISPPNRKRNQNYPRLLLQRKGLMQKNGGQKSCDTVLLRCSKVF
jgi:hypothetical protein